MIMYSMYSFQTNLKEFALILLFFFIVNVSENN